MVNMCQNVEKGQIYAFQTLKSDIQIDQMKFIYGQLISTIIVKLNIKINKKLLTSFGMQKEVPEIDPFSTLKVDDTDDDNDDRQSAYEKLRCHMALQS